MESISISWKGQDGMMYLKEDHTIHIEIDGVTLIQIHTLLSATTYGKERITLVWSTSCGRHGITVRITSEPAIRTLDMIKSHW
ncbi:MAG: hypothetical protein OXC46_06420 [Thaumarchaeota archaeon]|nr:hypothetical protein [Nitrososphaerota archaeon]